MGAKVVATRVSNDRLARNRLPGAERETARYASLVPGVTASHLHYRGPQTGDDGQLPVSGLVKFYVIELEGHVEVEG